MAYGTRKFNQKWFPIILILNRNNPISRTIPIYLFNLILYYHLRVDLPRGLEFSISPSYSNFLQVLSFIPRVILCSQFVPNRDKWQQVIYFREKFSPRTGSPAVCARALPTAPPRRITKPSHNFSLRRSPLFSKLALVPSIRNGEHQCSHCSN